MINFHRWETLVYIRCIFNEKSWTGLFIYISKSYFDNRNLRVAEYFDYFPVD